MAGSTVDVTDLKPGQHAYVTFASDLEQTHVLADFVRSGLARNERVLYFSYRKAPSEIAAQLRRRNIDTDRLLAANRLVLEAANGTYLNNGHFDAAATTSKWSAAISETMSAGYAAVRVAADMSWAADEVSGADQLALYESALSEAFSTGHLIELCEFDRRIIPPEMLADLIRRHGHEVRIHPIHASYKFEVRLIREPPGAAVSGEVDVYNYEALESALEDLLTALDGDVHLDLLDLHFIDARGLGAIVRCARRLEPNKLVLYGLHPYIQSMLGICGWTEIPNLVIDTA